MKNTLDVWPAFPLLIQDAAFQAEGLEDNVIALLGHRDRVCQIKLANVPVSHLKKVLPAMQKPFPELTSLMLWAYGEMMPVLPDSFLGGSTPYLHSLSLHRIPFPSLPKLLLSSTHIVNLHLNGIPHSGYISPEAMVTTLSTLTRLNSLALDFQSPLSCPGRASRRPPPETRTVLSVFSIFRFKGVSEYLDDLVACIDAPRLSFLDIILFNDIVFDTPQLTQFISRTPLKALEEARVTFQAGAAMIFFSSRAPGYGRLNVRILCREVDWQLSGLGQVCTSSLPAFSKLEYLYFKTIFPQAPDWPDNIENTLWLELLRPFTTVRNLYLSEEFGARIGRALQEPVGGRTTELLPTLQNILSDEPQPSVLFQDIGLFLLARQTTSHRIVVSNWKDEESQLQ
jgi:hypothetical protein